MSGSRPRAELLDRTDVALVLGVSVKTVERLLRRGELPSLRVGSRRLIRRIDLDRWIEERVERARA